MSRTISRARRFVRRTNGQTMPEYAVALAVVASATAFLFPVLGSRVIAIVNEVAALLH
jgi:Flp pilus assembly pilin Flp